MSQEERQICQSLCQQIEKGLFLFVDEEFIVFSSQNQVLITSRPLIYHSIIFHPGIQSMRVALEREAQNPLKQVTAVNHSRR